MIKCLTATVFAAQWDRIGSENKAARAVCNHRSPGPNHPRSGYDK